MILLPPQRSGRRRFSFNATGLPVTSGLALLLVFAFGLTVKAQSASKRAFVEKEVSFNTEDGWTIRGILSLPPTLAQGEKVAGVVLVPSPFHDRDIYGHNGYPSVRAILEKDNIATLRIDIRGRGRSAEPQEYRFFSEEQRARIALDVSRAIEFLSQQEKVDPMRIGVIAEGRSAEAALVAACKDTRVRGLLLLSGRIGQAAKDQVATRADLPVLCVVSREDETSFVDMADVYKLSRNPASKLLVYQDIGLGSAMFIMWAAKFPEEKPLEAIVGEWLIAQLRLLTDSQEVSFQTQDGWTLSGSLRRPRHGRQMKAPGVVLVHSNLSDRYVFDELERMLAEAGFVTLNFDFRGRGKSRSKGSYFELSQEERDKGYLDVKAALDYLGTLANVDADRLIVVATSIGVRYGLKAANADARV
ncbi:MAG TPA: hypothetical protein VNO70_05720, partial [Blastocatellia bacterium]|nr:hypothetical protein [Blastocatellia bacterium]